MLEMAALHAQLTKILAQKYADVDFDTRVKDKLQALVTLALKKAMAAGWADQVRKHAPQSMMS